jgi:hypothetical protein
MKDLALLSYAHVIESTHFVTRARIGVNHYIALDAVCISHDYTCITEAVVEFYWTDLFYEFKDLVFKKCF